MRGDESWGNDFLLLQKLLYTGVFIGFSCSTMYMPTEEEEEEEVAVVYIH